MNAVRENLIEARNLLINKSWGQNHYALTEDGRSVNTNEPEAFCFCTMGAIYAATGTPYHKPELVKDEIKALGFSDEAEILLWNDSLSRVKSQVLDRFNYAIQRLAA